MPARLIRLTLATYTRDLHSLNVRRVESLLARLNLELDFLSLDERLESIHRDGGEVHEDIFATLLFDEAEALGIIEPLHLSLGHCRSPARDRSPPSAEGQAGDGLRRLYRSEVIFCQVDTIHITGSANDARPCRSRIGSTAKAAGAEIRFPGSCR